MDDKLQSEMKTLAEQSNEDEQPEATFLPHRALHNSVHHLKKPRQQLDKVHSAVQALDHFLATVRDVKAEISTLLTNQEPSGLQSEAGWEQERLSWQAVLQQRLQVMAEQSDRADSRLKAAEMTLTMDGASVTCQDVVTSLSKHVAKTLVRTRKIEKENEMNLRDKEEMRRIEELNPSDVGHRNTGQGSPQVQKPPVSSRDVEESTLEAKRSRLSGEDDTKTQEEEEQKAQAWRCEDDDIDQSGRSGVQVKGEKERLVQRRAALIGALMEINGAAEHLGLQEPSLPALQLRYNKTLKLPSLNIQVFILLTKKPQTVETYNIYEHFLH